MSSTINASNSGFGGIVSTGDSSGQLQLQTAGTTAVTIDTSQNVGIGTTSPSTYGTGLTVYNATITGVKNFGNASINIAAKALGTAQSQLAGYSFYPTFVGTVDNGPRRAADIWSGFNNGAWGAQYLAFGVGNAQNDTQDLTPERMRIDTNGYLLVGYTSSNGAYKLQVNSQIFATSSTIATSDAKYKTDVLPISGALDIVNALNPVEFNWKQHPVHAFDTENKTVGFLAQEVEAVIKDKPYVNSIIKKNTCVIKPEVKNEEGNVTKEAVTEEFLGIAEGNMIAILTKAIQEQQALIVSQSELITNLTARVTALEAK